MSKIAADSPDKIHLSVRQVTKTFGRFVALRDVSLEVQRGEFICILGPSGCGKTTLLRIVAGLEEQNAGQIIQDGVDISHFPPSKRDFGIVFQSYALFPNLTVSQNIAYGLENTKRPKAEITAKVKELLALVGMEELAERYPAQLSGGQQQRVALSRALALSPGLLLLDEPLSALDARVRASLRIEVAQLQRRLGVTTMMVTHDQEEALVMADRIVVMNQGAIVQVGTPRDIYRCPVTPFVADFVGTMNFLPATVVAGNGSLSVQCCDGQVDVEQPIGDMRTGNAVWLAIRPEEVLLLENDISMANTLHAELEEVQFLGPFYRLRLRTGCSQQDSLKLTVNVSSDVGLPYELSKGMFLLLHLPSDRLRVFPAMDRAMPARPA